MLGGTITTPPDSLAEACHGIQSDAVNSLPTLGWGRIERLITACQRSLDNGEYGARDIVADGRANAINLGPQCPVLTGPCHR